jgi:hypothetical protein
MCSGLKICTFCSFFGGVWHLVYQLAWGYAAAHIIPILIYWLNYRILLGLLPFHFLTHITHVIGEVVGESHFNVYVGLSPKSLKKISAVYFLCKL